MKNTFPLFAVLLFLFCPGLSLAGGAVARGALVGGAIAGGALAQQNHPATDTIEIIGDPGYTKGLLLKGNDSRHPAPYGKVMPFGGKAAPVWEVAQWGSAQLISSRPLAPQEGAVRYGDASKTITVWPRRSGQVRLELLGSKEYKHPRKPNESWPHLLLEQRFAAPVQLARLNMLNYHIDAQLVYVKNQMLAGTFKEDLHTAQVTLFLFVQNQTKGSKGYGDYIWFGLPLYDYRHKMVPAYKAEDAGKSDATGKYIYSLSSADLTRYSLHTGNWVSMTMNVYPHLKAAYEEAKTKGYLEDTEWGDLRIGAMNIGWEMPGTFDAAIQWKNLRLTGITQP